MWYYFVPVTLLFSYVGRKLGWALSKALLYTAPAYVVTGLCLLWGILVAISVQGLILWFEPGAVLRWIFGYALGLYVAAPNFGLLRESSVPPKAKDRHLLVQVLPVVAYLVVMFGFGFGS